MQRNKDFLSPLKKLFNERFTYIHPEGKYIRPQDTYISRQRFYLRCLHFYPNIVLPFLLQENIRFVTNLPNRDKRDVMPINVIHIAKGNADAVHISVLYNDCDFIFYLAKDVKTEHLVGFDEPLNLSQQLNLMLAYNSLNDTAIKLQSLDNLENGQTCVAAIEAIIDKSDVSGAEKLAMKVVMMMCAMTYHLNKASQREYQSRMLFGRPVDLDWIDALYAYLTQNPDQKATPLIYKFIKNVLSDQITLFNCNSRFIRFISQDQANCAIAKLNKNGVQLAIPYSTMSAPTQICVAYQKSDKTIAHVIFSSYEEMQKHIVENGELKRCIVPTVLITPEELQQISAGKTLTRSEQKISDFQVETAVKKDQSPLLTQGTFASRAAAGERSSEFSVVRDDAMRKGQ